MRARSKAGLFLICIILLLLAGCASNATPSPVAMQLGEDLTPTEPSTTTLPPTPTSTPTAQPTATTTPPPTATSRPTPTYTPEPTETATSTATATATPLPSDVPPVVVIDAPLEARVGDEIVLDASETFDWDGDAIQFHWVQFHNPDKYTGTEYVTGNDTRICNLEGQCAQYPKALSGSEQVKFVPEWPGNYRFVVTASDKDGVSEKKVDVLVRLKESLGWEFRGASAGAVATWDMEKATLEEIDQKLAEMKSVGVNSFQIGFAWFMDGYEDSTVEPIHIKSELPIGTPPHALPTVSDERIIEVIQLAHKNGLTVYLRPGVEAIENDDWNWRGNIDPQDIDQWWTSYTNYLLHYAKIADESNVEMFGIGYEMDSIVGQTERWNTLIAKIRETYSGMISYDCGGLHYYGPQSDYNSSSVSSWHGIQYSDFVYNLDRVGIDWYPSLTSDGYATVQELSSNVQNIIDNFIIPFYNKYGVPIYFGEIDYSSQNFTTINPLKYRYGGVGLTDKEEQSRGYEAVFSALSDEEFFTGFFPTGFFITPFFNPEQDQTIWNKPVQQVFQLWYTD